MGIPKLMDFIQTKFPSAIRSVQIHQYAQQNLAIDASNWIYQFLIKIQSIRNDSVYAPTDWMGNHTGHLIGIMSRVFHLLQNNVTPIWVFDGIPPQQKYDELKRRKEKKIQAEEKAEEALEEGQMTNLLKMTQRTVKITSNEKNDAIKLIRFLGLPVIESPSQAQPQCAWLVKNNFAIATISEDLDTLTFGCQRLLRYYNKKDNSLEVCLSKLLAQSQLTYQQFVDFCILCGCDYSGKISQIGPANAYKLIKKLNNIDNIIEYIMKDEKLRKKHKISENFNHLRARTLFMEPEVKTINESDLEMKDFDEEGFATFLTQKQFNEEKIENWIQNIKALRYSLV